MVIADVDTGPARAKAVTLDRDSRLGFSAEHISGQLNRLESSESYTKPGPDSSKIRSLPFQSESL